MRNGLFVFWLMISGLISFGQKSIKDTCLIMKDGEFKNIYFDCSVHNYRTGQYDKAIEFGKLFLDQPDNDKTRDGMFTLMYKRIICEDFADIYKYKHDTLTALKYYLMIDKHFKYYYHGGISRKCHVTDLYNDIIECYIALNYKKGIARYQKKIAELEKK